MYGTIHHKTVERLNGGPMRLAMAACITVNLNELYNIARSMSQTIVQKELVSLYTFSTFQSSQVIDVALSDLFARLALSREFLT